MHTIRITPPFRIGSLLAAAALPAAAFLAAHGAHAQDKATLDLLVKKGTITQAEADAALKANAASLPVGARNTAVKKLQIGGRLHIQYDYIATDDKAPGASNPPSTSQFMIRRAFLGAFADLGNGWSGELEMDFAAGAGTSAAPQAQATRNNFSKAIISKNLTDYGIGSVGYTKVQWSQEENTSSANIKAVERAISTNYFTGAYGGSTTGRLGFGNRYAGLFWNGIIKDIPGLTYGVSMNNGIQSSTSFASTNPSFNQFSFWGNTAYAGKWGDFGYKVGFNLGYSTDGNSNINQGNYIVGYNPYTTLTYKNFELQAEFLQAGVQNGRRQGAATNTSEAWPYGITVQPSYKINDQWEIVARFAYLATNGRGMSISAVERNAPNTTGAPGSVQNYDDAWSAYIGFNYYIVGNSVKLTAGYEFARFNDRQTVANGPFNGASADVSAFRTRLQLLF